MKLVFRVLGFVLLAESSNLAEAQTGSAPVTLTKLASRTQFVGDSARQLTFYRQELPSPTYAELIAYLKLHPDKNAFPNVAFYIVDAPLARLSDARVIWISYDYWNKNSRPWPVWSADISWHGPRNAYYALLIKSQVIRADISVHELDVSRHVAKYPLELDPARVEQWPGAASPLSQLNLDMLGERTCNISNAGLMSENTGLLVLANHEGGDCAPFYLRFDLGSKLWFKLKPDSTPLGKREDKANEPLR